MISREVFAAFSDELEKLAIFSAIGKGAKSLASAGGSALGAVGNAAVKNPKAALLTTGALGTAGFIGYKGLQGAQQGYNQAASVGNLPGNRS
jgi:hypothetical protein